jgi:hypothetical protein
MKKQILISVLVILSISFLLTGCSINKQNNKNIKTIDIGTVMVGEYFGKPYELYSSFIPTLTLDSSNKFKLELGINKSVEGTYLIDKNKLDLTSSDGDESYILSISNNILIIEQEIPKYVKKGTEFKIFEKE